MGNCLMDRVSVLQDEKFWRFLYNVNIINTTELYALNVAKMVTFMLFYCV